MASNPVFLAFLPVSTFGGSSRFGGLTMVAFAEVWTGLPDSFAFSPRFLIRSSISARLAA
eukprot:6472048-Amphidinium_carterae.1